MKNQEEKQTKTVREKREKKNKAQVLFWICLNITFICIVLTTVYKCKFTSKETTQKKEDWWKQNRQTNQENERPKQAVQGENEDTQGMKTR